MKRSTTTDSTKPDAATNPVDIPVKFNKAAWQRAIFALVVAQLLSACAFGFSAPLTPLYVQTLGVRGEDQVALWSGLLTSSAGWTLAFTSPLWGALADRYGRKLMVLRATFGGMIILGAMGFVTSVEQLLVLRFVQGLTTGVVVAITALVASFTPRERLGRSLGVLQTALFAGNSLGPLIGGILADNYGPRVPFYLTGIVLGISGLIVLLLVYEPPISRLPNRANANTARFGWWHAFSGGMRTIATPTMIAMIAILWLVSLAQSIIAPVLPLIVQILEGDNGRVATNSGLIMGITGITSAVSAIWLGRISEKFGYRRMLVICSAGAALVYLPQAFATTTWHLIVLRGILGLFLGGLGPTSQAVIAEVTPRDRRGASFGMTSSAGSLGFAIGPLLGAGIAVFSYSWVFITTAILLFVVAYAVSRLKIEQTEEEPEGLPNLEPESQKPVEPSKDA